MKGTIIIAVRELVSLKFGNEKWEQALKEAGLEKIPILTPGSDFEETAAMKLLSTLPRILGITNQQLLEAFAAYWVHDYSQKYYKAFYTFNKTAKDFIKYLSQIHVDMTKNLSGANPPQFTYDWKSEKHVVMTYYSQRNLIDLAVCLLKEVGNYYHEDLTVKKIDEKTIEVIFSK